MELRFDLCSLGNVQLGSKGGTVVRALASYHFGPGSNTGIKAICGMSLLLVLSFASKRFFSWYSCFPLSLKANTFKFQFDIECMDKFQ